MNFDNGKDVPEYEAFEAALQIAERETTAAMMRVSKIYQSEKQKDETFGSKDVPTAAQSD
jgi:hypothetical protein